MVKMTFREMNLNVFEGRPNSRVLFQPRVEPWYDWHRSFGSLPERYREFELREFLDDLGLSMRYMHYYTGNPDPVVRCLSPAVRVHEQFGDAIGARVYETPYGDLIESYKFTVDRTWREVGFPVREVADLKKLVWLFEEMTYHFSESAFEQGSSYMGGRGIPQFWVPKSPYQALVQQWMKLDDFIYALADAPGEIERVMQAIDVSYDSLYEEMIVSGAVQIVNFGENLHEQLLSPRYFERYFIPFYERRVGQLKRAGIYSHVHIDGYFRSLLKYLKDLPFDGYEALTPLPQGDVALEEIKEYIGDKVLLDGIPAVMFLSSYTPDALMATVERVVGLFHPRLILGVSDEVPQGAGDNAIARLRMVSDWCRDYAAPSH
ncbi:MAG: hypothetical protein GX620_13850 [Chloroflexi bacterium]|nr:hypothetical protein [Chloroflexota bacterium]